MVNESAVQWFWVMSVVTSQCITFEQFPDVIIQRFCSDGCVMDWTKIMGRLLYTIYTHCLKLMKLVRSHGSSSLLFMMKVIVWHFVSDTHITALICVVLVWVSFGTNRKITFKVLLSCSAISCQCFNWLLLLHWIFVSLMFLHLQCYNLSVNLHLGSGCTSKCS
jgi:hypothetical protein